MVFGNPRDPFAWLALETLFSTQGAIAFDTLAT